MTGYPSALGAQILTELEGEKDAAILEIQTEGAAQVALASDEADRAEAAAGEAEATAVEFSGALGDVERTVPSLDPWRYLVVDTEDRPVMGQKTDGSWWRSVRGVLTPWVLADLIVPTVGNWRELTVDADDRLVFGVKHDGSRWRASGGAVLEEGGSVIDPNAYDYEYTTGTAVLTSASNIDYLVIVVGQSLAIGVNNAGVGPISTTAAHPGSALMPSVGVFPDGRAFSSYADLREATYNTVNHETICSGMADRLMRGFQADLGYKPRMIFACAGKGSQAYYGSPSDASGGLKRGTAQYAEALRVVQRCTAISAAFGRKLQVAAIVFVHGEDDQAANTPRSFYARALSNWHANLSDDIIRMTGQLESIPGYISQVNRSGSGGAGLGSEPMIAMAQLDAQEVNPALRTSGGMYFADNSGDNNHPGPLGYRRIGQTIGDMIFRDRFGPYFGALYMIEAWWVSATKFRVRFTLPIGIESDDSRVVISTLGAGKGVDFVDDTGSSWLVSGIAVVSGAPDTLEVTLSGAPTGKRHRVFIACRRDGGTQISGREHGFRSGIRAATPFTTDPYDSADLYHWAAQQFLDIRS